MLGEARCAKGLFEKYALFFIIPLDATSVIEIIHFTFNDTQTWQFKAVSDDNLINILVSVMTTKSQPN